MPYSKALVEYNKKTKAKQRKGYTEIKLAGANGDADAAAGGGKGTPKAELVYAKNDGVAPSRHSPAVQNLMKFFFDEKLMESSIVSVNVDVRRMPLGKLSKETVLKGYSILNSIENAIKAKSGH